MPHRLIENMSRRGEKIAPFLTVENLMGLMVSGVIGYVLKSLLPDGIGQFALLGGCLLLGYIATLDHQGMARYERVVVRLRGVLRAQLHGRTIAPSDLPGSAIHVRATVVARDGLVRLRPTRDQRSSRAHAARQRLLRQSAIPAAGEREPAMPPAAAD